MKRETQEMSKLIRQYISDIGPSVEILLYGSRARGDERKYSDWDILILTDYPTDLKTESKFRDKLFDFELETGESFSVFAYSKKDWHTVQRITPFYHNVIREGVSI